MKRKINIVSKIKYIVTHPTIRYYVRNPLILLRNRFIVFSLTLRKIMKKDLNFYDSIFSDIPIDVVLTAIDKDYEVLGYVIDSIRENIKHPIGDIVIISPKSDIIINLCEEKNCRFVDENTVLPIVRKDIDYFVDGVDRSGWLFQQLLKWASSSLVNNEYFLITDADTVFCRPQIFINNGKIIFSFNDRLPHVPYIKAYRKLLGTNTPALLNFVSHHSMIKKSILSDLKRSIEERFSKDWYEAILLNIDKKESSSFSEYDTYGYFVFNNYKDKYLLEHWCNLSLKRDSLRNLSQIVESKMSNYKTISFHSYNK